MAKKRAPTRKPAPTEQGFVGATMAITDTTPRTMSYNPSDAAMVRRCLAQSMAIAVAINAQTCAQQPLRLYRRGATQNGKSLWKGRRVKSRHTLGYLRGSMAVNAGRKTASMLAEEDGIEEVLDHPALTLVRDPDPWQTGGDWMLLAFWFLEATGKFYSMKGKRVIGLPASLFPLFPQYVTVQGDRTDMIGGYRYGRNSTDTKFYQPEDVIFHRRTPSVLTPYLDAFSWPQSLQLEGDVENAAIQAEIARWNNGGFPGMTIELDPTMPFDPVKLKQIQQNLADQVRGVRKNGGLLVLSKGKLAQQQTKPNEMGYKDGLEVLHRKVLWAAGIPNAMADMKSSSLANAYRADPQYMGETINPRICKFADELTQYLLIDDLGLEDYFFAFDCPVAEDRAALVDEMVKLTGGVTPIIDTDEARAQLGYDPREVEEEEDAPLPEPARPNLTELQALMSAVKTEAIDAEAAKEAVTLAYPSVPAEEVARLIDSITVTGPVAPIDPATGLPGVGPKPDGGAGDGQKPGGVGGGDGGTKKLTEEVIVTKEAELPNQPKEVDAALADLRAKLKPWYEQAMSQGVTDAGMVNVEKFMPELHAIISVGMSQVMNAAARDAAKEVGGAPDVGLNNPRAVLWAKENAAQAVTQISDTLRTALQERVTAGLENSQSIAEIQASIQQEAPDFSANRAETIARTETSQAQTAGSLLAYKANGVTMKDFILAGGPCAVCEAVKAAYPNPIPIDEPYMVDGVPYQGKPFHPNCRCDMVPVLDAPEESES